MCIIKNLPLNLQKEQSRKIWREVFHAMRRIFTELLKKIIVQLLFQIVNITAKESSLEVKTAVDIPTPRPNRKMASDRKNA